MGSSGQEEEKEGEGREGAGGQEWARRECCCQHGDRIFCFSCQTKIMLTCRH